MRERLEQCLAQPRRSVGYRSGLDAREPVFDPADDVAVGQVAHEQEEAVRGLVQPAVTQILLGEGTLGLVLGVGAEAGALAIAAGLESPVAPQLGAAR